MTNAQSFPLCRLPSVACDCVIQQMDLREQYIMSTLSNRASHAVRVALLRETYTFYFEMRDCKRSITLMNCSTEEKLDVQILYTDDEEEASDAAVFRIDDDDLMVYVFEIQLESLHIVFKCSGISLEFGSHPAIYGILEQLVPEIRRLRLNLLKVAIFTGFSDNKLFEYVMENFRDADELSNRVYTTSDYRYKGTEPFTLRSFELAPPLRFNLHRFSRLFMSCRLVEIVRLDRHITPAMLNGFLKNWVEGSKLEHIEFNFPYSPDIEAILKGIEKEPVDEAYMRNSSEEFEDGEAFKIRLNGGVEAVACISRYNLFVVTTHFANPDCDLWPEEDDDY